MRDAGGLEGISNTLNSGCKSCDFSGLSVSIVRPSAKYAELSTMDKDVVPHGNRAGGGLGG